MKAQKEKRQAIQKTLLTKDGKACAVSNSIVRVLSLLIIGFLVIQGSLALFSHVTQAIQIRTTLEPKTHAEQIIEDVLKEDPGATVVEQTESSLKFRLSNGQYRLVSVTGKLFTQDGKAIDPTLVEPQDSEWIAQTTEGLDYRLKFKADSTRRYYPKKDKDSEYIEIGAPEYLDGGKWQELPLGKPNIERNRLFFEEPDYTLEHLATPNGAKVNLILNNKSFNKPIRWPISTLNLTKVGETLVSDIDGEAVASFAPPRWYDAKEQSGDISYAIEDSYLTYATPILLGATYPITIDPTLNIGVAVGGDDYYAWHGNYGASGFNNADVSARMGHWDQWSAPLLDYVTRNYHVGTRFDNVTIPSGSSITNATIAFRTVASGYGTVTYTYRIYLVDEDDAAAATDLTTDTADHSAFTTAYTTWTYAHIDADNQALTTPNFAGTVQEVIDRSGWASGNALLVVPLLTSGYTQPQIEYQYIATYEHTTYTEPTISITYTLETTPPTVSTLSPADNAIGVSQTANLVITFSEAVDAEAGANNDIVIKKTSDSSTVETIDAQDAKVTGSGTATITVNPATVLAEQTGYYVQIGADAFDDAVGNSYAGISDTTSWNFTTADTTNPTVSTVSPADNAIGVSQTANLVITFSEAVDAEAGANNDIVIKKTSDNSTVETIDAQNAKVTGSGTNTITINPDVALDADTDYYIQIGADAFDDAAGNSYAGVSDTTLWNFTTKTALPGQMIIYSRGRALTREKTIQVILSILKLGGKVEVRSFKEVETPSGIFDNCGS